MAQPPGDYACVKTTKPEAAAAARIGAGLARRKRAELLELLRPCFARVEPWLQAGKYAAALMSQIPRCNGWTLAEQAGDRTPDRMQRLLSRAVWDTSAAMRAVRRFAVGGLDQAVRTGGRRSLAVGAIDETGQVKQGECTAGVKRHYLGCAGKVANGITTVHLAYAREGTGHALIAARQWIPREHLDDPARRKLMGLPPDLAFRTKGQLAIDLIGEVLADGVRLDFACGDEVYGSCTQLREYLEARSQAYVLRVPSNFYLTVARGVRLTCKDAARQLAGDLRWEVRSAGKGSKGQRWYAWTWLATASARHYLLIRRHLATGELAFCYCYVPENQPVSLSRLIRAAGCRWPVEEDFRSGKGCFGLDESQVRLYTAIARHTVLVMAALAICAVTAALLRHRTDTRAPAPVRPDQHPPADPGLIPLTVPETARLLARPPPPGAAGNWLAWRRRHQALSAWYHQRTRLARESKFLQVQ
jgi:SRSO17 transposase